MISLHEKIWQRIKKRMLLAYLVIVTALLCILSSADEPKKRFNIPLPTMGGKQYWSDVELYGGWRIQQSVFTKHYRLLSPKDIRRAWGSLEQCRYVLEEAKIKGKARLRSDKVCVLIHGYWRSKDSMKGLKKGLQNAGYQVYGINYPSTRLEIEKFAVQVRGILEQIRPDFEEINIVTHSMGGIVARSVLSKEDSPEVNRLVMVAPPNQGAVLADLLEHWWPKGYITGPAGEQLMTDVESYSRNAGVPKCEFGIIAGKRGTENGWNPIVPGDDDAVVGVANTKLEGMKDFIVIRGIHTTIMNNEESISQTLNFLKTGKFNPDNAIERGE